MAITNEMQTGFIEFRGNEQINELDPATRAIHEFIELGGLARNNMLNLSAALRSVFSSVVASFQERQLLEQQLANLLITKNNLEANEDTPQADIVAINEQIKAVEARIAAATDAPNQAVSSIHKIRIQIEDGNNKEGNKQILSDKLIATAISLQSEEGNKKKQRDNVQYFDELDNLNYEKYKEISYDLFREFFASRKPENYEVLQLTPMQIGSIFFEFGIDPNLIDVGIRDPIAGEILQPLLEAVELKVLHQEIRALKEEQDTLDNRQTLPPEEAPLLLGQVQPLALAFGQPSARDADLPPEQPRERGKAEKTLDLPAELEGSDDGEFLTISPPWTPPQRSLEALIDTKLARYNDLKAKVENRLGLTLLALDDDATGGELIKPRAHEDGQDFQRDDIGSSSEAGLSDRRDRRHSDERTIILEV
jgi:hypothetical protein